jgi:S1-C subfamily serine protease
MLVEAVGVASGTGFQVDSKGHVVTNRHVVSGASKFRVHTTGGRTLTAELLGKSATHDVAVLQVKGLKARPLAWLAGKPKMGLGVLVLGFPGGPHAGHPLTATLGIVSGTGRNVGSGYKDMVQFDAAINHGNSGGPVLDGSGRVVAVATASASVPDPNDPPRASTTGCSARTPKPWSSGSPASPGRPGWRRRPRRPRWRPRRRSGRRPPGRPR